MTCFDILPKNEEYRTNSIFKNLKFLGWPSPSALLNLKFKDFISTITIWCGLPCAGGPQCFVYALRPLETYILTFPTYIVRQATASLLIMPHGTETQIHLTLEIKLVSSQFFLIFYSVFHALSEYTPRAFLCGLELSLLIACPMNSKLILVQEVPINNEIILLNVGAN